jgi:hypothetical protein
MKFSRCRIASDAEIAPCSEALNPAFLAPGRSCESGSARLAAKLQGRDFIGPSLIVAAMTQRVTSSAIPKETLLPRASSAFRGIWPTCQRTGDVVADTGDCSQNLRKNDPQKEARANRDEDLVGNCFVHDMRSCT